MLERGVARRREWRRRGRGTRSSSELAAAEPSIATFFAVGDLQAEISSQCHVLVAVLLGLRLQKHPFVSDNFVSHRQRPRSS